MRILALDQYGEIAGAQRCLVDAVAGFAERGWETHAAVPDGPLAAELWRYCSSVQSIVCGPFEPGTKTARDAVRFGTQFLEQAFSIRRVLTRRSFDALYVTGPRLMPAVAVAVGPRLPVVFHAHNRIAQRAVARIVRAALDWSGAYIVASSEFVAAPLDARVIVHNGVAPNPRARARRDPPIVIATIGRVAPEKGTLEFVRAAGRMREPGCRYIVVGEPLFSAAEYARSVESEAERTGVELLGWYDDIPRFLAEHVDLLVVPSTDADATPRVVLEAFAARVPVVAFAAGGLPEMIRDTDTGILVRPRSSDALATTISDLLRRPERLAEIAGRAYADWACNWSIDIYQAALCAALEDAVARRHQRKPLASAGAIAEA